MKKLLLVLVCVALATVLFVGCLQTGTTPAPEVLSADISVIDWEQDWTGVWECVGEGGGVSGCVCVRTYGEVTIDYLICNTGTVDIDFSRILFEVTYKDRSKDVYRVWLNGIPVDVDYCKSACIKGVWVGDRKVSDVVAIDWELASY